MAEVLNWVAQRYPELELRIAWNQPIFTHHGTYIIGVSAPSQHMAMAPEHATIICFEAAKHGLSVRLLGPPVEHHGRPPHSYIRWWCSAEYQGFHHHACRRCAWALLG